MKKSLPLTVAAVAVAAAVPLVGAGPASASGCVTPAEYNALYAGLTTAQTNLITGATPYAYGGAFTSGGIKFRKNNYTPCTPKGGYVQITEWYITGEGWKLSSKSAWFVY